MKITIKLGGFCFPADLNMKKIKAYAELISELYKEGNQFVIVTGGGRNARKYIEAAKELNASQALCDQIGILATRLNARLLITSLGDIVYPDVPESLEELRQYLLLGRIVVMGGLQPGHSTNAVAALAAETIGASILVNLTDVDGIYTADPKKEPKARRFDEISTTKLLSIVSRGSVTAGGYQLLDSVSVKIIERSKIPTWIVSGDDPENIIRILKGEHIGTKITT